MQFCKQRTMDTINREHLYDTRVQERVGLEAQAQKRGDKNEMQNTPRAQTAAFELAAPATVERVEMQDFGGK